MKNIKENGIGAGVSVIGPISSGPTNVVGTGQIAGAGVGPQGEPGGSKAKMGNVSKRKLKDFSENAIFDLIKRVISESTQEKEKAAELFARCRNASTMAHAAHLMTNSYAEHVALNDFYEEIIDLIDKFSEAFIGRYGKFTSFPTASSDGKTGLEVVKGLRSWIDNNRDSCGKFSELQNIIDEINDLCDSTIYKLENLK